MYLRRYFKAVPLTIELMVLSSFSMVPVTFAVAPLALQWELTTDLSKPESVVYDETNQRLYVSNISGGYISTVTTDGNVQEMFWVTGLNNPRGMAIHGDNLYVATDFGLIEIDIPSATIAQSYDVASLDIQTFLINDVTADRNGNVYVSDTFGNSIYVLLKGASMLQVWLQNNPELEKINGLLAEQDRLVVTTMVEGKGQLKAIDIRHGTISILSEEFPSDATFLDGVASDHWVGYYVTDYLSSKLFHVDGDSGKVTEIVAPGLSENTADLTYIPQQSLLVIPLMNGDKLLALKEQPEGVSLNLRQASCTPISATNIKLYNLSVKGLSDQFYGEFVWNPIELSFTLVSTNPYGIDNPKWDYEHTVENGSMNWGDIHPQYAFCKKGKNQSPIRIKPSQVAKLADSTPPSFNYQATPLKILNNGHSIQVDYGQGNGSMTFNGVEYQLRQFHFHSPSEHRVGDIKAGNSAIVSQITYDLELHLVHEDDFGNIAVVAILFRATNDSLNQILQPIFDNAPSQKSEPAFEDSNQTINAQDFVSLSEGTLSYYIYNGSLTTPPCSEGVLWIVEAPSSSRTIDSSQLEQFQQLMGNHDNNRDVQPLNNRLILEVSKTF